MKRVSRVGLACLAALTLGGCATPYSGSGIAGGYFERRVNDRLVQVNFTGNGFSTPERIQTFALYRCAEIARDAKKPYFLLYDSLTAAARGAPAALPRVGTLGGKPGAFAFLVLEDEPRTGSHDAQEIIARLGPSVDLGADVSRRQK